MTDLTLPTRMQNVTNHHQGAHKRVLCVCSAGILRSPTIAWVLGRRPWYFNTRAAGVDPHYALIPVDPVLVSWADEIVCAHQEHADALRVKFADTLDPGVPVYTLNIPDRYAYRDPVLVRMIRDRYREATP